MGNDHQYPPLPSLIREGEEKNNPLSLWEREKILNERSEFSILGDGSISSSSGTECHLLQQRGEGNGLLKHGCQSGVQEILKRVQDDMNPLPQSLPRGREAEKLSSHYILYHFLKRTYSPIHLFSYSARKRLAFTLAEVLITLGIIGVVAAMTIPGLIADYQKKVLVSQFKKSYSNLSNALNLVQAEYGTVYECYNTGFGGYHTDECKPFFEDYLKKINIIKECSGWKNNCHPKYKNKSEVLAAGGEVNNLACSFDIDAYTTYYTLSDGSLFALQNTANSHHQVFPLVDVNGMKGPNKWGYDLYMLTFQRNNEGQNVILSNNVCAMKEKNGMYIKEVLGE